MLLAAGRAEWSEAECRLWSDLRGPRFSVNLRGAEHVTPSDAVWLAKGAIKTGSMGPEKTIEAIRHYIAAFLDANLRGKPPDGLLTGPSAEFPDAEMTTQKQNNRCAAKLPSIRMRRKRPCPDKEDALDYDMGVRKPERLPASRYYRKATNTVNSTEKQGGYMKSRVLPYTIAMAVIAESPSSPPLPRKTTRPNQ